MPQVECPFCSNPNFLAAATKGRATKIEVLLPFHARQEKFWRSELREYNKTVTTDVEKRGEYLHTSFYGDDFEPRWRDFTVDVIGIEAGKPIFPRDDDRVIPSPPTPFFFFASVADTNVAPFRYQHFFVARITHKLSNVEMIVHWWPTHGRRFKMLSSLIPEETNDDINVITEAMEFFRVETRGEPKLTESDVVKAIQKLGDEATQVSVASELGVTARTVQRWAARNGLLTWEEVKERYSSASVR
jgi:hypothetical protein